MRALVIGFALLLTGPAAASVPSVIGVDYVYCFPAGRCLSGTWQFPVSATDRKRAPAPAGLKVTPRGVDPAICGMLSKRVRDFLVTPGALVRTGTVAITGCRRIGRGDIRA